MSHTKPVFLSARWENLIFANYVVEDELLENLVPKGTIFSRWNSKIFISLVAFQFSNTKIFGIPALLHKDFNEVNLRFYVERHSEENKRQGVVFINEIVPSKIIAWAANTIYGENYIARPMTRRIHTESDMNVFEYGIKNEGSWNKISVRINSDPDEFQDSDQGFYITEHYWGYSKNSPSRTVEYEVEHPQWPVYRVKDYELGINFGALYGSDYSFLTDVVPDSVFFCQGSDIKVRLGKRL